MTRFSNFLVFILTIQLCLSVSAVSEGQQASNQQGSAPVREKRFAIFDKIKKKTIFQKFVDDGLSPETEMLLVRHMKKMHSEFITKEDDTVELPCNNKASQAVLRDYPRSSFRWSVNEKSVAMDPSRMFLLNGNFQIRNLKPEDAGVYVCFIVYNKDNFKTAGIFPLTVKSETVTKSVHENDDLTLRCHSNIFSNMFSDIEIEWYFNGTKRDMDGSLKEELVLHNIPTSLAGVWSCLVKEPTTKRTWHTAWYLVGVEPARNRNVHERIWTLVKTNKLLTFLLVLGFITACLIVLCICVYTAGKVKTKNEQQMGSMKDRVMAMQGNNLFGMNNLNLQHESANSSISEVYSDYVTSDESARLIPRYSDYY